MNKDQLHRCFENPASIGAEALPELEALTERYPWCAPLQMVYAKGLHTTNDIRYHDVLKQAAIAVPNRKVLYTTIMQAALQDSIREAEAELRVITHLKEKKEPIVQESAPDNPPVEATSAPTPEVTETPVVVEKGAKAEAETPEESSNEKSESTIPELEEQFLKEAISASISLEVSGYDLEASTAHLEAEREREREALEGEQDGESEALESESESESEVEEVKTSGSLRFSDWLSGDTPTKLEEKVTILAEEHEQKKDDKGRLIELFLKEDPKIKARRAEFFSPTNVAKMSLVDQPGFVSETLAKVYASQGNYDKAISAYQQLALKFPEKSSYFAGLIQELEEKI